jgi:hypothetical protein
MLIGLSGKHKLLQVLESKVLPRSTLSIVNYWIKDAKLAFMNFIFHEDHFYRLQNDQKIISPERKSCASFMFLE